MANCPHPIWTALRNERQRAGMSVRAAATLLDHRSDNSLSAWERGARQATLFQTDEVAELHGLRLGLVPASTAGIAYDVSTLDAMVDYCQVLAGRHFDWSRRL
jgi:hypothetical protein